jgi:hypothetical protein
MNTVLTKFYNIRIICIIYYFSLLALGDHQYYVRDANKCVSNLSNNVSIVALDTLL